MKFKLWKSCAYFIVLSLFSAPSFTQEKYSEKANDFVLNNSLFVLYHEIGHLLISELDIPILGREENAADNFATIELLKLSTKQANNLLIDSANGWFLSGKQLGNDNPTSEDFYGEHNLDVQRAYQIVCLMVGKDNATFKQVANEVGLSPERQESCYYDYLLAKQSWETVLTPYKTNQTKTLNMRAIYDRSVGFLSARKVLQNNRLLENAIEGVLSEYKFPNEFNLRAKSCNEANAFYDSWVSELLFCYELANYFYEIYDETKVAIKATWGQEIKQEIQDDRKDKNKKGTTPNKEEN